MFAIVAKALGTLPGALGLAALLASAGAAVQTIRLNGTQAKLEVAQASLTNETARADLAVTAANERGKALEARDALITEQSASIDGLKVQSELDRSTYLAGIHRADTGARTNEARAAELVRVPVQVPDDRCEAARSLIEQEMLNVR